MKIWKAYGSAHSANLTVIGRFRNIEDAQLAEQVVEDFVNANFGERYSDCGAFAKAWRDRLPAMELLGPSDRDYEMGIDAPCEMTRDKTIVKVSDIRSQEIGGIIKLMLLKDPEKIEVTGRTGP